MTGVEINYERATFQLPQKKLIKYISTCHVISKKKKSTIGELEYIVGVLNYCLGVVPYGKVRCQVLYAARSKKYNRRKSELIEVSAEIREDPIWWATALASN
jgi:hypothetical protein